MVRVAGTLQKSSEVMKLVNDSMKLPALRATVMNMSKGTRWPLGCQRVGGAGGPLRGGWGKVWGWRSWRCSRLRRLLPFERCALSTCQPTRPLPAP